MNAHRRVVRAAVIGLLGLVVSAPLSAQRGQRGRQARPVAEVERPVRVRTDFGAFAVTDRGVAFRSNRMRARLMFRALNRTRPRVFRRLMFEHRMLHRDMRRMNGRRAARAHRRWHREVGYTHQEFVRAQRFERSARWHRHW